MNERMRITFDIPITDEMPEGYLLQLAINSELRSKSERWTMRKTAYAHVPVRCGFSGPQEDLD